MEDRIRLSYFYGKEADQFSFYKIPKLLFTEEYFKKISVEAKVLYGLMLDRMSLSMKISGWTMKGELTYIIRLKISWRLWDAVIKGNIHNERIGHGCWYRFD